MFDFSLRADISDAAAQALRDDVRRECRCEPPCEEITRNAGCACYPEFSARLWLQTGAFPRAELARADIPDLNYIDPSSATSVARFLATPERAVPGGWSAVIHGDRGSGKTALATVMAKSLMRWATMRYTVRTRSIYYPFTEYRAMCDRTEKSFSRENEKEYLAESMHSTVVVWDDVDLHGAIHPRFVSDVKSRTAALVSSIIVLKDPIDSYELTELGVLLGIQQNQVFAHGWTALGLRGRILQGAGWT